MNNVWILKQFYKLKGNMFDWGAQAVTAILDCGLYEALEKIQQRPWLYDGLEKWLEKLQVRNIIMSRYTFFLFSVNSYF